MSTLTSALSGSRLALLLGVSALSLVLLTFGIAVVVFLVRAWRRREGTTQVGPKTMTPKRLLGAWENFLSPLPPPVRATLPDYDHFIVLGDPGVGKSAMISRRVDWQGQASQFLPSYTPDPLLQIYLGSRIVVEEISATLLAATSRETHEAFRKLWRAALPSNRPPTVIVALKASQLGNSSPDVIRQQAQLIRGKLNLLSDMYKAPIRTRICLTNMDRMRGYSEFARFLHKSRLPLQLEIGADAQGSLTAGLLAYEKYVPRALTMLPVGPFESSVSLLSSAEEVMAPVRTFIAALSEGSVASVRPDLQRLYFFSLPPDENVGNPFEAPGLAPAGAPSLYSRFTRFLARLGIRPLHALLSLLLLIVGVVPMAIVMRRHDERVKQAGVAVGELSQSVRRAQEALSIPSESDVVRRAQQQSTRALLEVESYEARYRPLRLLLQREKADIRQSFVDAVRQGYLRPAIESGVRQRARDKILYGLAAIYATRKNALGTIVRSQPEDFSSVLGLPVDLLLDYVKYSETPWSERVLLLLPQLPSESSRWPIADLGPWRDFVQSIVTAIPQPYITLDQLDRLRKEEGRLRETIDRVRKAAAMRRIFQVLSEESPLDMARLFGADAGVLTPDPWLRDNMQTIGRLLKLIRESTLQLNHKGRMSLFQLLKWINSLSTSGPRDGLPLSDDDLIHLAFPNNKLYEISERAWLELLLRSRKRLLLSHRVSNAAAGSPRPTPSRRHHQVDCCECPRQHRHRHRCVPCSQDADGDRGKTKRNFCQPPDQGRGANDSLGSRSSKMPPFSDAELQPRLANLLTSDQAPSERVAEEYNRALFDNEVLPLLRELKKALAESKALSPEEKIKLSRLVRKEIDGYAQSYCSALKRLHRSYYFRSGRGDDLHTELLNMVRPGSRFISHLYLVADNASLRGLDDPYLAPLAECLAEFKPIVKIMSSRGSGSQAAQTAKNEKSDKTDKGDKVDKSDKNDKEADAPRGGADREPEGLSPYLAAVAQLADELDAPPSRDKTAATDDKKDKADKGAAADKGPGLVDELAPVGRSALATFEGQEDSPRNQAENFLDKAGITGPLRQPFMEPFNAVYRRGAHEIERALAQHFEKQTLPLVTSLFTRFPFNQAAEREVAPDELDVLNETSGAFFQDIKNFYGPVLTQQGGVYQAKSAPSGPLVLPQQMLPTINRLARLSRVLFDASGKRQPLRFTVRGLPGPRASETTQVQPTVAFLQVGRASIYGFNQRTTAEPFAVSWWSQGAAVVGIERSSVRSGRRHTETLEVADSAWSLFRLLQKTTLGEGGVSTWRILGEGGKEGQVIRFAIEPDPWEPFRVKLP